MWLKRSLATKAADEANRRAKAVLYLDELLDTFGINLDRKSAAYRSLGLAVLRKEVAALEAIGWRTQGKAIETPPLAAIGSASTASGDTLTAALDGWTRERDRSPRTVIEYERAVQRFTELFGNLPVAQIKRIHARQFREALQNVPRTRIGKLLKAPLPELSEWGQAHPDAQKIEAGTINKLIGAIQAVCQWARKEHLLPDEWSDPFNKMRLEVNASEREPFELSELRAIFSSPIFTQGERPKGGQGETAFWLPLLALFGGERLGELAGLRVSDIAHNPLIGAVCIYITPDRKAGRRIKTKQSERYVPVHPQLIELGFAEFVAEQAEMRGEKAWLFPKVAPGTKGAEAFSN